MRVKVLGSAAGGGFPQWNCACSNCHRLRQGGFHGKARTQTQVAVSNHTGTWYLLGASADLRSQIESTSDLHPRTESPHTPIAGVVLTGGDLDHVLGLLLLREFQPLHLYATAGIRRILTEDNSVFKLLQRVPEQIKWHDIHPATPFELPGGAAGHGFRCHPIGLTGKYPAYVTPERQAVLLAEEAVIGLMINEMTADSETPPKRILFAPSLPGVGAELLSKLESCDVIFVDGTFWSDDELVRTRGAGSNAREMGHLPISGPEGSLRLLASLRHPRKIFIHVNNTNPILDEDSAEHRQVREAGWEIAEDGMEFQI